VELDLGEAKEFNAVYLTFDTNLNRQHNRTPGLHRDPECARDYTIYYADGGAWKPLAVVEGNYQRRRVHRFEAVRSQRIRLEIRATNGDPSARIYEMRVYRED
jgi:hypothetical protein